MGVYWECWELWTNYGGQREQRKPRAGVGVSHRVPGTISAYYTSSQLSAMEAWLSLRGPQLPEAKAKRLLQQFAIKMISPGGEGRTLSYLITFK